MKNRLIRWSIYFRRGHATYFSFGMSFVNFVVIQYRLLIEYVPTLEAVFSSLSLFALIFFLLYLPLSTVVGWFDMKRFSVPITAEITAQVNPYSRDIARALMLIAEGDSQAAKRILQKWI